MGGTKARRFHAPIFAKSFEALMKNEVNLGWIEMK
jgi:hypothetical protein